MKPVRFHHSIVFLFIGLSLILPSCKTEPKLSHESTIPNKYFPYSFNKAPFINPRIIQDLSTWISDKGDQVVAINLLDSQNSNRYFCDAEVRQIEGQNSYVFTSATTIKDGETNITEFGYRFVGVTSSGIYVIETADNGGGSGTFMSLLLLRFENDRTMDSDWGKGEIRPAENRLLIKKLGEIALGDRWDGKLRVDGDLIIVGDQKLKLSER